MRTKRFVAAASALLASLFPVQASADLSDGLMAYYPFDGNAQDASGNGNHGTVVGLSLAQDRFGHPSRAYAFDRNGYININNTALLDGATAASISGWVRNRVTAGDV